MSLEAWGDDEAELIDAIENPVSAALADVRDEITGRIKVMAGRLRTTPSGGIPSELWQAQIRELRSLQGYVEDKIAFQMEPRQ